MTMEFHCKVIGTPVPQGSSKGFNRGGRVIITSANKNLKPWRNTMASNFVEAIGSRQAPLFSGPVEVSATFIMPRIASLPKSREKAHTVKPDLDKLLRALGDSLSESQVLADDALITQYSNLKKRYALVGEAPGVEVTVKLVVDEIAIDGGTARAKTSTDPKQFSLYEDAFTGEKHFSGPGPVPAREING